MKKHKLNPFRFGKIVGDDNFCNRINEIEILKNNILDGNSVWLYSPRRFGKTSLVKKVMREMKDVKTIYFDLYNVKSLDDFCKRYSILIADELFDWKDNVKELSNKFSRSFKGLRPSVTFDENGNPSFSLQAERVEKQVDVETILEIPNEISLKNKSRVCIAFDEFQEISRIDPFLINWMRSSFQNHYNISYLFLGSKHSLMQNLFSSYNSPFYEFAIKLNIKPIGHDDLYRYIERRFQSSGIVVLPRVINDILSLSGGHPHFTQYFASEAFYLIMAGVSQEDENFTLQWITKVIESQSHIFQNMFDQLSNNQRKVLVAVAELNEKDELFSLKYREKFDLPVSSSVTTTLKSMVKKDMIAKNNKKYEIINPVFREWLKTLQ